MSWLTIVFWILTNIPTIISLIEELIKLIHGVPIADRMAYRNHIAKAIATGDKDLVQSTVQDCLAAVKTPILDTH